MAVSVQYDTAVAAENPAAAWRNSQAVQDRLAGVRADTASSQQSVGASLAALNISVEQVIVLRQDAPAPSGNATSVRGDTVPAIERTGAARTDTGIPIKLSGAARTDLGLPIEWTATTFVVLADSRTPIEWTTTAISDTIGRDDISTASGIDSGIPIELSGAARTDTGLPIEQTSAARSDVSALIDAASFVRRDVTSQQDFATTVLAWIASQQEFVTGSMIDLGLPIEWTTTAISDTIGRDDISTASGIDSGLPIEWTGAAFTDFALIAEWMVSVMFTDSRMPAELSGAARSDVSLPMEQTATASRDASASAEALNSIRLEIVAAINIAASAASDTAVPIEGLRNSLLIVGSTAVALEWLTTASGDVIVLAGLHTGLILPAWLARGAVVFVTADANAIAVLAPRSALRIVSDANAIAVLAPRSALRIVSDANAVLVPLEPSA